MKKRIKEEERVVERKKEMERESEREMKTMVDAIQIGRLRFRKKLDRFNNEKIFSLLLKRSSFFTKSH